MFWRRLRANAAPSDQSGPVIDWEKRAHPRSAVVDFAYSKQRIYKAALRQVIDANIDLLADKRRNQAGIVSGVFGVSSYRATNIQKKGLAAVLVDEGIPSLTVWDMEAGAEAIHDAQLREEAYGDGGDEGRVVEIIARDPYIENPITGELRWEVERDRIIAPENGGAVSIYSIEAFRQRLAEIASKAGAISLDNHPDNKL